LFSLLHTDVLHQNGFTNARTLYNALSLSATRMRMSRMRQLRVHRDIVLAVGLECCPPELVFASAGHVVAAAILFNGFLAPRTALDPDAHYLLHIHVGWCLSRILWLPLVFADKAHHRVMAQITQAPAIGLWTIYLDSRREQHILTQSTTPRDHRHALKLAYSVGLTRHMPPYVDAYEFAAPGRKAPSNVLTVGTAVWDLNLRPHRPTSLTHRVVARRVHNHSPVAVAADDAGGARFKRLHSATCGEMGKPSTRRARFILKAAYDDRLGAQIAPQFGADHRLTTWGNALHAVPSLIPASRNVLFCPVRPAGLASAMATILICGDRPIALLANVAGRAWVKVGTGHL